MKSMGRMFFYMVKQMTQEMMMIMLLMAPILAGVFFRFGIPFLEQKVLRHYGWEKVLIPYYEEFSWLFAMLTGMLFAFAGGLVVLEELDTYVAKYIMVTPAGIRGYLGSRIVIPAVVSGVITMIFVPLFSLVSISFGTLLLMTAATMLGGIVTVFLVIAISSNKVEGMAVGKISGLFSMTYFVPLVITGNIKYLFFAFPMFWVGEWSQSGGWWNIAVAFALFVVWICLLYWKLKKGRIAV